MTERTSTTGAYPGDGHATVPGEGRCYLTLTLTVALVRATPAAVALTHFGAPAGAAAQPCAVTSVSFAATFARSECVPFLSLAEAANEPVAPVVADATFLEPSRIVTAIPGAPT